MNHGNNAEPDSHDDRLPPVTGSSPDVSPVPPALCTPPTPEGGSNMHLDHDDQPLSIDWRTQITITAEQHSIITRNTVSRAVAGIRTVAPVVDIVVVGSCDIVDLDAGMDLGPILRNVEQLTLSAHGRGVPRFIASIQYGIEDHRRFLAELQQRHEKRSA